MVEEKVRLVLQRMGGEISGKAFPGADGLQDPEWERDPFHVLIATVLSQRTKDANTYKAAKQLFARFEGPFDLAGADVKEVEELIRPSGFYQVKARGIKQICMILMERHDGKVPDKMEDLLALPLVGRKTANCVLAYGFGKEGLCVDTHVHRISNRLGWVMTRHADETEMELRRIVPSDLWCELNSIMVRFGQGTCLPQRPRCQTCPVKKDCDFGSNHP
jgi:endonuclease-3